MNKEMKMIITETMFGDCKSKIKIGENIKDYFNSFKIENLKFMLLFKMWIPGDKEIIYELIESKNKKNIVDYIINNLKTIIKEYVKILEDKEIEQINYIISKKGYLKFNVYEDVIANELSIKFISILRKLSFAKIDYNNKTKDMVIYMPDDILKITEEVINRKEILTYNKRFNEVMKYIITASNIYGVIPINELYMIIKKIARLDNCDELEDMILAKSAIDEIINVHLINGEPYLCNMEFYEKEAAIELLEKMTGNYCIYNKKEFEEFKNKKRLKKLKSYQKFVKYLIDNFEGIEDDIDLIDEDIVSDFLITIQTNKDSAKKCLYTLIEEIFEIDEEEKEEIFNYLMDIYEEYPKWIKKGHV